MEAGGAMGKGAEEMTPIKVALIHRDSPRCMDKRMVGWWSYPVPEFEWEHIVKGKGFRIDKSKLRNYDIIVYEDAKIYGTFIGSGPPVCYCVGDSTVDNAHYQHRLKESRQADLILVDQDKLRRFKQWGIPVRRFGYCVNDVLFHDYDLKKTVDVCLHYISKNRPKRAEFREQLVALCARKGHVLKKETHEYEEYAKAFSRAKIAVDFGEYPQVRAHRGFDVMASRTCLVTSPLPSISGEKREAGRHYFEYQNAEHLETLLGNLLSSGLWRKIADAGYKLVQEHHTWAIRAQELKKTLQQEGIC